MAPARAFENLWPSRITFALGAVATGLLSLLMQPWYVLAAFHNYIFTWLGTYGTLLGPFDGIAIADYWLVRQLRLSLAELYQPAGRYDYARGWNARAISALIVGWIPPLIGLIYPALSVGRRVVLQHHRRRVRLRRVHAQRSLAPDARRVRRDHRDVAARGRGHANGAGGSPGLALRGGGFEFFKLKLELLDLAVEVGACLDLLDHEPGHLVLHPDQRAL